MLFRYYNPSSGRIVIEGKDVEDITIDSFRKRVGVLSQDCNMFNESIMCNLKSADQSATNDQIYDAYRAASIHDRIMALPNGYATRFGPSGCAPRWRVEQKVSFLSYFSLSPSRSKLAPFLQSLLNMTYPKPLAAHKDDRLGEKIRAKPRYPKIFSPRRHVRLVDLHHHQ